MGDFTRLFRASPGPTAQPPEARPLGGPGPLPLSTPGSTPGFTPPPALPDYRPAAVRSDSVFPGSPTAPPAANPPALPNPPGLPANKPGQVPLPPYMNPDASLVPPSALPSMPGPSEYTRIISGLTLPGAGAATPKLPLGNPPPVFQQPAPAPASDANAGKSGLAPWLIAGLVVIVLVAIVLVVIVALI